MKSIDPRKKVAVLRVLRAVNQPLGGTRIAREVESYGLNVSPRTLRLYLEQLEADGLVESIGQRGRRITPRGVQELNSANVARRLAFTSARVDALAYQTTFRPASGAGSVVANVSLVGEHELTPALHAMAPVVAGGLGMGRYVACARPGERVGDVQIPAGKRGIATVCSVTMNGILRTAGIPVVSRFGGVLELRRREPVGFTDAICFDGTSIDPMDLFLRSGMTSVSQAARTGDGRIAAVFSEVPSAAVPKVERLCRRLDRIGLNGVLMLGRRDQPLLEVPVSSGRTGMIVADGLNPIGAAHEAGIGTTNYAMCSLLDFARLEPFTAVASRELASAGAD